MRTQLNVPLEFVESEIADRCIPGGAVLIEDIEFDEHSRLAVVTVEVDTESAVKLPWIDADDEDMYGIPV